MENKELEALKEKYADFIASLSDEDKAKVEACTTAEELTELARNSDGELPDDIAEAVAGGKNISLDGYVYVCDNCGYKIKVTFRGDQNCPACRSHMSRTD